MFPPDRRLPPRSCSAVFVSRFRRPHPVTRTHTPWKTARRLLVFNRRPPKTLAYSLAGDKKPQNIFSSSILHSNIKLRPTKIQVKDVKLCPGRVCRVDANHANLSYIVVHYLLQVPPRACATWTKL